MDWGFFYIIEKFLKLRCLKWAHITHLDTPNTSYGQNKGWESNCQFDSRPLKVRNLLDFLACRCRTTYHWIVIDKGYNFASRFISIEALHTKLWAPKVVGVLAVRISGVSGQNDIWVLVPWLAIDYTIRGKPLASPKSRPWWVLWIWVCPWLVLALKVFQLCTNQLVVWFHVGPCEWLSARHSS